MARLLLLGAVMSTLAASSAMLSTSAGAQTSAARTQALRTASTSTVTITQADSGRSYTLAAGDRLIVRLAGPAYATWTKPSSSNARALVRRSATSGTTAKATFQALAEGTATVSAADVARCAPQCAMVTHLFRVTISVS